MRAKKHEVLFICGTDEHGTPAELAAKNSGKSVAVFCEEMWSKQKKIADQFLISFDFFGRSSSKRNHSLTQHFAAKLDENGFIEEVFEKQFYSNTDKRYLPDRYIQGTCPSCNYDKARGDQCENCTKQLNPTDLKSPKSAISGSTDLTVRETKHLYLKQSKIKKRLLNWIESKTDWPILTTSIAKKWLNDKDGLKDRGITRDLDWGVKVQKGNEPWLGFEKKVFYVWFDAPIAYIAATAEWSDSNKFDDQAWQRWWIHSKGASDVRYVQFMAKDNIPFHTISFPGTIIGSGEDWKLVDYIKGFNWLLYEGGKFSTSEKRGIFMDAALEILPADYWRWWLLSNAPENSDTDFTWDEFQIGINKDLADTLGNFVSRVTKFSVSKFGNKIPQGGSYGSLESAIGEKLSTSLARYEGFLETLQIRKAASELRVMWSYGNEYMQEAQPWSVYKSSPAKAAHISRFSLNLIRIYSIISEPFIPHSCKIIRDSLELKSNTNWPENLINDLSILEGGQTFRVPELLFRKITDDEKDTFKTQFYGV